MIVHVILFAPRPDLNSAQRLKVFDAFRSAALSAPTVRGVRTGRRVRHGLPGYELAMREDFEYLAILEFDDLEGLVAYLKHPAHGAAGQHFTASAEAALAYDYAIVSPEELVVSNATDVDAARGTGLSEESKKD
jgi:hypothetical protein